MSKKLEIITAKLEEIKERKKIARKINKKVSKIKSELVDYWCCAFDVDSVPKQIITMMFDRLGIIDMVEMQGLIDSCANRMRYSNPAACSRYMAGIMRNHLSRLGIDYGRDIAKRGSK